MNYDAVIQGLIQQGLTLQTQGQHAEAESRFRSVLQFNPEQPFALYFLGVIESDRGNDRAAVDHIRAALAADPSMYGAYVNLGLVVRRLGELEEAVACYDKAIRLNPCVALAHFNRGNALRDLGRMEDAFSSFVRAAEIEPSDPDAFNNCGSILWKSGKFAPALPYFEKALQLDPHHVEAAVNKASVLEKTGGQDEALLIYEGILARQPGHVIALVNRGAILEARGQIDDALACFREAQRYAPEDKGANLNEAFCLLKLGEFKNGWQKYEWRLWGDQNLPVRTFTQPRWSGEPLRGMVVLLHPEQGLGDTLQFCRYAALLASGGATVVLEAPPSLANILETLDGVSTVVKSGDPLPPFDVHVPLMSVPFSLGDLGLSIPSRVPYLSPPKEKKPAWQETLNGHDVPRVAVVWGTTTATQQEKTIPLSEFAVLFDSQAEFFVAQKVLNDEERELLKAYDNVTVLTDELQDFSDTAVLLSAMDITVTIDTSVAHLAGAMALPVWVLLHEAADWRWMLGRDDSDWYPSARLFRREPGQPWATVIASVRKALERLRE